ncbi:MAG: FkbM family methyltransferase [Candidatus Latescibacteria bacterium]|nr:FkbM family methyltransferase [Candidatus Latescibacterota bacterium]
MIRKLAQGFLNGLGYELRRTQTAGFKASYLAKICQPKTVIDVGVAHGTYPLYEAYPEARFILVEPLIDYSESIATIANRYNCEIHYKAVGERVCELEINVDSGRLTRSSLMDRSALSTTGNTLEKRVIEVTTLDTIYAESSAMEGPIVLKIDTEGYELPALLGARSLLGAVDFVIAEVSIAQRFENGYQFEDFIAYMRENGFQVFSLLKVSHRRDEAQTRHADIVFKRPSGKAGFDLT